MPAAEGALVAAVVGEGGDGGSVRLLHAQRERDGVVLARLFGDRGLSAWIAGLLMSIVEFGLEAVALDLGPLILVQPLIVSELLFALPLAAISSGRRFGPREWSGALLLAGGLILFLVMARPTDLHFQASGPKWVTLFCVTAFVTAILFSLAQRSRGAGRTSVLAAAAGVTTGLLSVVTKATARDFSLNGVLASPHGFHGFWR